MKYLLSMEVKDPIVENTEKILAVESERGKKGITLSGKFVLGWHYAGTEPRMYGVVEVDDEFLIAKWLMDYLPYAHVKAMPLLERSAYEKRWSSIR